MGMGRRQGARGADRLAHMQMWPQGVGWGGEDGAARRAFDGGWVALGEGVYVLIDADPRVRHGALEVLAPGSRATITRSTYRHRHGRFHHLDVAVPGFARS